jgi:DNA-binding XRE family transcriptional regulator
MTQVDLAKKIKKSKVTVNYWCSNKNQPSLNTLSEIARVLNVKISDLIIE